MAKSKRECRLVWLRSSGVAAWQEKMNREAANGSSVLPMARVDKLEETIMDLLREYRMNTFAQQLHE